MAEPQLTDPYDSDFFEDLREGSQRSAIVIVPLVMDWIEPRCVVDVGSGDGTWLSVFQSHGVDDILGIDGEYVEADLLQIPPERFIPWDLSQPIDISRRFDLAVSLEVAEHLPPESADSFVTSLVQLSDVILFSAAIPHQGGTHHVNEQWPDYWITRFQARGYVVIDALRQSIWTNADVQPWYAQNTFLFVKEDFLQNNFKLKALFQNKVNTEDSQAAIVHPAIYLQKCLLSSDSDESKPLSRLELTQSIEILDVVLFPSAIVQSGDSLKIRLCYQLKKPIDSALFSISLSNSSGDIYLDTEFVKTNLSAKLGIPLTVELRIDRLDLVKGDYFINPGIFSVDWAETYDFHWHRYPFVIQSSIPQKAVICPPLHWSESGSPVTGKKLWN